MATHPYRCVAAINFALLVACLPLDSSSHARVCCTLQHPTHRRTDIDPVFGTKQYDEIAHNLMINSHHVNSRGDHSAMEAIDNDVRPRASRPLSAIYDACGYNRPF